MPNDLQQAIDQSDEWLSQRQLSLAPQKYAVLKIKKASDNSQFHINNYPVKEVQMFRDLGILMSSDLKWSAHISSITNSASVTSYQIWKFIKTKNIWTWVRLFKMYVRPKLEFNSTICSPLLSKDIKRLEAVQEQYTKFAFKRCSIPFESYESRLGKSSLSSFHTHLFRFGAYVQNIQQHLRSKF